MRLEAGKIGEFVDDSWPIMVESMSARNSFLRRPAQAARQCRSAPRRRPAPRARGARAATASPVKGRSAALPSSMASAARPGWRQQRRARHARRKYRTRPIVSACLSGLHDYMISFRQGRPAVALIAGPTASGKSAHALAVRKGPAAPSSTPIPCRSIATSESFPPARAAEEARVRTGGSAMSMPPRIIRLAGWVPGRPPGRHWTRPTREGRVPILVGGTGLYFKVLTPGAFRRCRRRRPRSAPRCGPDCDAEGPAALHTELARRDPAIGRAAQARRPHADRPGLGSAGGDRTIARGLAPRWHAGDPLDPDEKRALKIFLAVDRDRAASAGSTPGSTPCWRPARWTR